MTIRKSIFLTCILPLQSVYFFISIDWAFSSRTNLACARILDPPNPKTRKTHLPNLGPSWADLDISISTHFWASWWQKTARFWTTFRRPPNDLQLARILNELGLKKWPNFDRFSTSKVQRLRGTRVSKSDQFEVVWQSILCQNWHYEVWVFWLLDWLNRVTRFDEFLISRNNQTATFRDWQFAIAS